MKFLGNITHRGKEYNLIFYEEIHSLRLENINQDTINLTINISGLEKNQIAFFFNDSTKEIFEILYNAGIVSEPITWISDTVLLCNVF